MGEVQKRKIEMDKMKKGIESHKAEEQQTL
jgi:hypothetical protein